MNRLSTAVIMPAYNPDPVLLQQAIAPLLEQTEPVDIVIIDDGSTPPVGSVIAPHPRIDVLRLDRNGGVTAARNAGLRHILDAGYTYIACNDADDVSDRDRIRIQLARLEADPTLDVIGAMAPTYDHGGKLLFTRGTAGGPAAIKRRIGQNLPFAHSSFCFRADVVARFGAYSEDFPAGEDYEFLYRIIHRGGHVDCVDAPLVQYLLNPDGITYNNWRRQILTRLKTQLRYFSPLSASCYLGVARSVVTLLVPHIVWRPLKKLIRALTTRS
jgi:glycosyltransferase involved in cell wall biosynthesis